MNLVQARQALSDGYRVSFKGKEFTTKDGKFFMDGKSYVDKMVDARSTEFILMSPDSNIKKPAPRKRNPPVKKAVAPKKSAAPKKR